MKDPVMWQPIETAPKDGTPVLIWSNGRLYDALWDEDEYNPETEEFTGGWKARWAEIDSYSVSVKNPTHWMPSPPPPMNL
jgi:hypothetical protein